MVEVVVVAAVVLSVAAQWLCSRCSDVGASLVMLVDTVKTMVVVGRKFSSVANDGRNSVLVVIA